MTIFDDERLYYPDDPKSSCCDAPLMDCYEPGNYGRCSGCKECTTSSEQADNSTLIRNNSHKNKRKS